MTVSCALWWFSGGCAGYEVNAGSLPEWLTWFVTLLALAAAAYAGVQAKKAADSAREQAGAANAALISAQAQAEAAQQSLEHARTQADAALETVASSQTQAQAALDSVKHSADAAESARVQADAAQRAFEADAKVREEAQARLVYSEIINFRYVEKDKKLTSEDDHWVKTVWDEDAVSPWKDTDDTGLPLRNRRTTRDAVKVSVKVHNRSAEIIAPVWVHLFQPETPNESKVVQSTEIIPPGESEIYHVVIPVAPGTNIYDGTLPEALFASWVQVLRFQDSAGVRWTRIGSEPIRKIIE